MSAISIRKALIGALNNMLPALATSWENKAYSPVSGTPYQEVNFLFAEPENREYGSQYREQGYMQVTLKYPLNVGAGDAIERAELIRSTFKRGSTFSYGGINVIVSGTPEIVPGIPNGDRYVVPVKVRFFANVT